MASTFANRDTNWYIRTDGNELNGGGFDPWVTGAGTNYADAASPIISSTTGTCTVGSTTWTDTGVTFTSAMVGNVMRISAKTGGSAIALDYFVITAFIDANNVTLDRTPCASANITAATYRVGGAFAHLKSLATNSASGTNNPVLSTPLIAGQYINVRGSGTEDPSSVDYDWSNDYWNFPSGAQYSLNGAIHWVGYNGRPLVGHRGLLIFTGADHCVEHMSFKQTNGTWLNHPLWEEASTNFYNCIMDQNGYDSMMMWFGNSFNDSAACIGCELRNSGGGAAGTGFGIKHKHGGGFIYGTWIHDLRGRGVWAVGCYGINQNCVIDHCGSDGFYNDETDSSAPIPIIFCSNTVDANGGHGLNFAANSMHNVAVFNNIISNHTGASKYGVNFADTYKLNTQKYRYLFGFNNYYGNTTNFNSISSTPTWALNPSQDAQLVGDLTLDPQYTNAAGDDWSPSGNNMKRVGILSFALPNTDYVVNIGAVFKT